MQSVTWRLSTETFTQSSYFWCGSSSFPPLYWVFPGSCLDEMRERWVSPWLGGTGEGLGRVSTCSLYRDFPTLLSPTFLSNFRGTLCLCLFQGFLNVKQLAPYWLIVWPQLSLLCLLSYFQIFVDVSLSAVFILPYSLYYCGFIVSFYLWTIIIVQWFLEGVEEMHVLALSTLS